jgi:hypothetical protein
MPQQELDNAQQLALMSSRRYDRKTEPQSGNRAGLELTVVQKKANNISLAKTSLPSPKSLPDPVERLQGLFL